jgi:chromosome segregation ATPase
MCCCTLQESERETCELQQQLSAAAEERAKLQTALEAASSRQHEHQQLATDLTHAVQQQKGQLQALQHDKEDLQRQLQRCTPKEFDRLHVELLGAKRKAAELPLVQEQLQRQKQLWSEAEQRLADLQAAAARSQEEASAKQASVSAQLSTARNELAAVKKEHKQLQQQLANAQDAVKVSTLHAQLRSLPVDSAFSMSFYQMLGPDATRCWYGSQLL